MRYALIALFAVGCAHSPSDKWFAYDKALHFGGSAVLADAGYALGGQFSDKTSVKLATGFGLSLSFGIAKELRDYAGYGEPSWRDLTVDVAGALVGLAISYGMEQLILHLK